MDRPALWLAAALGAGFVYETQNVGTQGFIFLWPAMLALPCRAGRAARAPERRLHGADCIAAIPPVESVLSRGVRAVLAQASHRPLAMRGWAGSGWSRNTRIRLPAPGPWSVSIAENPGTFRAFAERQMLPRAHPLCRP